MNRHRLRGIAATLAAVVFLSGMVIAPGVIASGAAVAAAADDDFATAPFHDWRTSVSDSVDAATDQWDIFRVYLDEGETYQFDLTGPGGAENFDLFLYYPGTTATGDYVNSAELAGSTESMTGVGDWAGHWYVAVRATSGSGAYTLTGTFTAPSDNIPGTPLRYCPVNTAYADSYSKWNDVYRIWLDAGDRIDLTLTLKKDPASATFVPSLLLFPPSATDVFADPAVASNMDATFPKTLTYSAATAGYYYVDIRDTFAAHEWGTCVLAWKVTPGIPDWICQNPLPNGEALSGVDFVDANTGWAVGAFGTIMKSADGGASWRLLPSGTTVPLNDVCFTDVSNGWTVGDAYTILRTSNGGETWVAQAAPGSSVGLYGIKMVSATTGWIVGNDGRILATTDGGTTWTPQTLAFTGTLMNCDFISTTTGWVVGAGGAVFKTTNGGADWAPQASNTTAGLECVDFVDANTGWAAGVPPVAPGGQFARTTDGGATWTPLRLTLTGSRTVYVRDIAFTDALNGWAACDLWGQGYILKTTDGGATWTAPVLGQGVPLRAIDMIDGSTGKIVGDGGTVWDTVDGTTWSVTRDADHQFSIFDLQFRGTSMGYAVGAGGKGISTTDGGATWTPRVVDALGGSVSGVHFSDDAHGIAVGTSGRIHRTADGGASWAPVTSGTTDYLRGVWCQSTTLAWAVGNSGRILKSENGGANWTPQTSGVSTALYQVRFATDTVGWAVGESGVILKTADGGANWTPQTSVVSGYLTGLFVQDAQHAWACGGSGIECTSDGGTTWNLQSSESGIADIGFGDASNGWAVSGTGLIYRTPDAGTTWIVQPYTRTLLRSLVVTGPTTAWAAGDAGTIFATSDAAPLVGTFFVNGNAAYSTSADIMLHSSVTGAATMEFRYWSPGDSGWSAWSTPSAYSSASPRTLDPAVNGVWQWNARYGDGIRTLDLTDSIIIDTLPPATPAVTATAVSASSIRLNWSSTDAGTGVASYEVYSGSTLIGTTAAPTATFTVNGLSSATPYTFSVKAIDGAAHTSGAGSASTTTLALSPVYRFFNRLTGTHLYTADAAEAVHIRITWPTTMRDEGVGYYIDPGTDTQPLYRLFNLQTGTHFYTADPAERAHVIATWPTIFRDEGYAYSVSLFPSGTKATVYRFYNLQTKTHFYTATEAEKDYVRATWPTTMRLEGPAFYVGQ